MTTCNQVFLVLPFAPVPAPRPRAVARGGFASVYMPGDYMKWKANLAGFIKANVKTPDAYFEGPVTVVATFYCEKPKTTKKFAPKGDIDNYLKSVLDACTDAETVWKDDDQVIKATPAKAFVEPGQEPCIHLTLIFGDAT